VVPTCYIICGTIMLYYLWYQHAISSVVPTCYIICGTNMLYHLWYQHVILSVVPTCYIICGTNSTVEQTTNIILDFKLLPCSEYHVLFSGWFTGVCSLNANVSQHSVYPIFTPTYEDGTHTVFWNIDIWTSDAGESPRRTQAYNKPQTESINNKNTIFEVFMVVKIYDVVFWVRTQDCMVS
jgi:hypothetical protein